MALLGTVLVTAIVLGLAAWGVLNMTGNAQKSVYGESTANQARTAALMGIQAITGYAQSVYVGNTPPASATLANLYPGTTPGLANGSGPVDQSFNQPTNANVQAMIKLNTFLVGASANGFIRVLSTGRSGPAIQTAESYLTAQLSTLRNNKYNVILGGQATLNGGVNNSPTDNKTVFVGYTQQNPPNNGGSNTVTYVHITSLPIINPNGLEQYSTIQLVNGMVTIPVSSIPFYVGLGYLPSSDSSTTTDFSCTPSTPNTCPSSLANFSYSSGTWTISGYIPAFIYSNQNIIFSESGSDQITTSGATKISGKIQTTVASTGNITTTSNGSTFYPFGSLSSSSTTNYCQYYPGLPICNAQAKPIEPYLQVQGIIYVVGGNNVITGSNDNFEGDMASVGELQVNGAGSFGFGGTTIAEGGYTHSNGTMKVTNPVAAANSATLGGYQMTPSSIRWVP
jgi:hypothetical protein